MPLAETFVRAGKVRDLHAVGDDLLLLVASDRISAFDVVLPTPVPDKGRVLTGLSRHWFAATADIVPNHLVATDPAAVPDALVGDDPATIAALRGRSLLVRRAEVLPVECVVRGHLAGSGWREYRERGRVCGVPLPPGLREADRLPEPIFTPAWKAPAGLHDENITFDRVVELVGPGLAEAVRDRSLALHARGAARCAEVGLILVDTKFEFGLLPDGSLVLVDEVMTPDSARFWEASAWSPGSTPPSHDKQYVRDWLDGSGWDHAPPGPELPAEVVAGTRARYVAAFERITGASFARYLQEDVIAP